MTKLIATLSLSSVFLTPPSAFAQPAAPAPPPPPTAVAAPTTGGPLMVRALAGPGYASYEDRMTAAADSHYFAQAAASLGVGYAVLRTPATSLVVGAELLFSRSLQGSVGSRAAANLFGGGATLSLFLEATNAEAGVGVLVVSRTREAQDLGLTKNRLNVGLEAFLAKYWAVTERLSFGLAGKFLLLPTSEFTDANGDKHIKFSEGIGFLGLGGTWR